MDGEKKLVLAGIPVTNGKWK